MTALAADRVNTIVAAAGARQRTGKVGAAVTIYKGAALCRNLTGYLVPAAATLGFAIVGIAEEYVNNAAGAAGAVEVKYLTAVSVRMKNDGTNTVAQVNLYGPVYVQDDQTVRSTPGVGVVAGIAEKLESNGDVVVYIAPEVAAFEAAGGGIETVTTATALSLYTRTSLLSPTGTMAMTLASGRYTGQRKTIRMIGGASTPIANVAAAYTTDGTATTSAAFNAAADQLELEWNGTAWQVLANTSVTLS
jgi:hypothetical protein